MKLSSLLEVDDDQKVIDISRGLKQDRRYTKGSSGFPEQSWAHWITQSMNKNKKELAPSNTTPKIKPFKLMQSAKLETLLKTEIPELQDAASPFLMVTNDKADDGSPYLHVSVFKHQLESIFQKEGKVAPEFLKRLTMVMQNRIEQTISDLLGTFCVKIVRSGMMGVPNYYLDGDQLGIAKAKPSLSGTIKAILEQKFNITGFGFPYTDKVATGYRVKLEGLELMNEQTFAHFVQELRSVFGDQFIKAKHDGEIQMIGHRPVGEGLTNYRIFFTSAIAQAYRK